ncbi:hypothetical protein JAAARDRAFT_614150 [Jaapia argillacea MUCL 33604]|uniref:Uncharacterized protein n=1 Tax=Jaapia argillacea MUCL 33604 TaxID=933084 RepID=A0A067P4Y1_9AGAM|nr:hypothetical protein JAAARDRAFT_614150 [Jaapia argillacea MUCL 33604]
MGLWVAMGEPRHRECRRPPEPEAKDVGRKARVSQFALYDGRLIEAWLKIERWRMEDGGWRSVTDRPLSKGTSSLPVLTSRLCRLPPATLKNGYRHRCLATVCPLYLAMLSTHSDQQYGRPAFGISRSATTNPAHRHPFEDDEENNHPYCYSGRQHPSCEV